MVRRRFLGLITFAGVGGAAALSAAAARHTGDRETLQCRVEGFTCVTCATGLETLLGRERGVLAVKATWPEGLATVSFDRRETSEAAILDCITAMGFRAEAVRVTGG